ncbi:4-galactosyl-N-acetylglucosaminide 3-alpha-L-fucosyltransferase FUT6-like [Penaeus japonicus]|uniref:4-galactosyl-N-acetylglucosaminide 3-alpha-L-fucosyltransferase FUT6-like n=1 Tax=Penaeus japonicus TaxID=27405 RepID=UPI001C715396|nr:4-galactosyl-N-acetylglucosaminide 3-alpha-L-fucosyltransferase FUT6-like [Penaeus japonicus]
MTVLCRSYRKLFLTLLLFFFFILFLCGKTDFLQTSRGAIVKLPPLLAAKVNQPVTHIYHQDLPPGRAVQVPSSRRVSAEGRRDTLNWRNLSREELNGLSVMGRRMFLDEDVGASEDKNFTILLWQNDPFSKGRLIYRFGTAKVDPFEACSVRNCRITYEKNEISKADAVYINFNHITSAKNHTFPKRSGPHQIWIWGTDLSSVHISWKAEDEKLRRYDGCFNWSMTFRMESDIPIPYGRTVSLPDTQTVQQLENYFDLKPKVAAVMMTNCRHSSNNRQGYVRELQKHMTVDFYGRCGKLKCPGHFTKDCKALEMYKFYLSFENSNCRDYISEKVWWNAFEKKAVPVVMGGEAEDYRRMLPPDSFVHIDHFDTPKDLAEYLKFLASNRESYMKYHQWRRRYKVVQEHGYFGAPVYHYCRICEALNYNDRTPKTYGSLGDYWNKKRQCQSPTWMERFKNSEERQGTARKASGTRRN